MLDRNRHVIVVFTPKLADTRTVAEAAAVDETKMASGAAAVAATAAAVSPIAPALLDGYDAAAWSLATGAAVVRDLVAENFTVCRLQVIAIAHVLKLRNLSL